MTTSLHIPIILGASRPERQSEKVATYIHTAMSQMPHITTQLVDIRDFHIEYDSNENNPEFHALVEKADAFVLVFPEYNHGFPGKLKSLLDTEGEAYERKPVVLASVSSGQFGGVRGMELLMPVIIHLGMIVTKHNLTFPYVEEAFTQTGEPTDPKTPERVTKALDQLISLTTILKDSE